MSYLSHYSNCIGCSVTKYCGTVVGSIKLCNSYDEPSIEEEGAYAEKQIALSLEIM